MPDRDSSLAPALIRLRFSAMQRLDAALGAIDELRAVGRRAASPDPGPNFVPVGEPLAIAGWIAHAGDAEPGAGVVVTVDGAFAVAAAFGTDRPDAAAALGGGPRPVGFDAVIPADALPPGARTIGVEWVRDIAGYHPGPQRTITVVDGALRLTIDTPAAAGFRVSVDEVAIIERPAVRDAAPAAEDGETISVRGWAVDVGHGAPCATVYALVDGVHLFRGRYGGARADVAAEFGDPRLVATGFDVRIDTGALRIGAHAVTVIALAADGATRSQPAAQCRFSVRDR